MDDLTKRRARLRRYTTSKISDADELVAFVEQMIRLALAGATPLALVLEVAARQINDACVHAWGIEVRMKYLGSSSVLAPYIAADMNWQLGKDRSHELIRAISGGIGSNEIDIATRWNAPPKVKTWDKERAKHDHLNRHYLMGGTAGRKLPGGDMTVVSALMLKLNHRQRVVYQGMVLDQPPRTRAEIARELGIRHLNQVSEILAQAQTKMNRWLKSLTPASAL